MKTAVIYKSNYGSTEQYAKWLSEKLECDLIEASKAGNSILRQYDTIIYGGGIYVGRIIGIDLITKQFDKLKQKNIIVFTVSLTDPGDPAAFKQIIENNLTGEMKEKVKIFHLRGGIDHSKLNFIHKMMIRMMKKMLSRKPDGLSEEDKLMLESSDYKDPASIEPIAEYVRKLQIA